MKHAAVESGDPTMAVDVNEPRSSPSTQSGAGPHRRMSHRRPNGRLLDLKEAEIYSGISAWTLRDLIASGALPAVRPPRLRRVWIDRADLDKAIAAWKDQAGVVGRP